MTKAATIPIIDLSRAQEDEARIAKELVDAAADYGFIYIKNTGQDITLGQVEKAFNIVGDNGRRSYRETPSDDTYMTCRAWPYQLPVLGTDFIATQPSQEPSSNLHWKTNNDVKYGKTTRVGLECIPRL
jgi:hypothetical protein